MGGRNANKLIKVILAKLPTTLTCNDFSMTPVWRARCKEYQWKVKDFRCVRLLDFFSLRRECTKSGPQYGEQNVRNICRKQKISGVCAVVGILVPSQKMYQEWAPVWRARCKEYLWKVIRVQVCAVARIFVPSQKMHQERAPVWSAKCKVENKMHGISLESEGFKCVLGFFSLRRKCTKSMESKT